MVTHLPALLRFLGEHQPQTAFRVRTGNLEECTAHVTRGDADILISFEVEADAPPGWSESMARVVLGDELLVPVIENHQGAMARFDAECPTEPIRLLNYPEESFLGRIVRQHCLPRLVREHSIDTICESTFTVGLKEMALAGMGIAWLPRGLVDRDLSTGRLRSLHEALGSVQLAIVAYRLVGNRSTAVDGVWEAIQAQETLLYR